MSIMKTIKVSEASGAVLDWLVAKCEGMSPVFTSHWCIPRSADDRRRVCTIERGWVQPFEPSKNPLCGWPIIERELIATEPWFLSAGYEHPNGLWVWRAHVLGPDNLDDPHTQQGPTSLVGGLRCYVASKLGETVEVPEELLL